MEERMYPGQIKETYHGKVRDVTEVGKFIVANSTNRISAFDVVLPKPIPFKGVTLNLTTANNMRATEDIIPNCLLAIPHPRISIWMKLEMFKVEMIVRAYLVGSSARDYKKGARTKSGVPLPEGLVENQKLPNFIVTPTTKAITGHDEDISREEIIARGLMTEAQFDYVAEKVLKIFERGSEMASLVGLILVDSKYEFGKDENGVIYLADEVHTGDSSRYFYADDYEERFAKGENPRQLSKEFVREWLIQRGFMGREGDQMPEFSDEFVQSISDRYIELYKQFGGDLMALPEVDDDSDLYDKVCEALKELQQI